MKYYVAPHTEAITMEAQGIIAESLPVSNTKNNDAGLVKGQKVHSFDYGWE